MARVGHAPQRGGHAFARAARGSTAALLEGFATFRATGAEVRAPSYLALLGDAYTQCARFEDGRKLLDEGLAVAEKNDDRCHEAELYRLQGELLLAESPDQIDRRRSLLPPGHRDGPPPAEPSVGTAGHDQAWPDSGSDSAATARPMMRCRPFTALMRKASIHRISGKPRRYSAQCAEQSSLDLKHDESWTRGTRRFSQKSRLPIPPLRGCSNTPFMRRFSAIAEKD